MGTLVRILPHYTYADYKNWPGQWEIIEGIPYAMSPLPRLRHQEIAGNIYSELKSALKKDGCNCKAFLPVDYKVNEETVLQPDVLVICDADVNATHIEKPPGLVVEILSPSTALKDRNTKFYIYETERVKYYMMVDTDSKKIELYLLNDSGKYQLVNADFNQLYTFNFENGCSASVQLSAIWQ